MPRRSVKKEHTAEILSALEVCITKYGVQGSTLDNIADEANIKRPALRHFIGNRDEIFLMLCDKLIKDASFQVGVVNDVINNDNSVSEQIDTLLAMFMANSLDRSAVLVSFFHYADKTDDRVLAKKLKKWHSEYVTWISDTISNHYDLFSNNHRR